MSDSDEETGLRLDIWLWRARFFKTRALATKFVSDRGVRLTRAGLTRKTTKPGTRIAVGDILGFGRRENLVSVSVEAFGTRRGPATEAAELYIDLEVESRGSENV